MMRSGCLCMVLIVIMSIFMLTFTGCVQSAEDETTVTTTASTTVKTTAPLPSIGWITADSMRVRSGAGLGYEVIGGITYGEMVQITGKSGDWYQIRFGEGIGYVSGQYLTFTQPTAATTTTTVVTANTTLAP